jgi:Flp pilus assembly pilin Flp
MGAADMALIMGLIRSANAAAAIEYGLIAALIAVAMLAALYNAGETVENSLNRVDEEMGVATAYKFETN